MIFDTLRAIKNRIKGNDAKFSTPIQDALARNIVVRWGAADPRKTLNGKPSELNYESQTNLSVKLSADTPNAALMRFPLKIASAMTNNGVSIWRRTPHPEARLLQMMISIRSEGRAADANVIKVRTELAKRLKHKSHLPVTTDIYRDGRNFTIQGLVLLTTSILQSPDGLVRRAFSYDMTYTIESWILFPDEVEDVKAAEIINLEFLDDDTGDVLDTASIPS